jgi:hypothetical protein
VQAKHSLAAGERGGQHPGLSSDVAHGSLVDAEPVKPEPRRAPKASGENVRHRAKSVPTLNCSLVSPVVRHEKVDSQQIIPRLRELEPSFRRFVLGFGGRPRVTQQRLCPNVPHGPVQLHVPNLFPRKPLALLNGGVVPPFNKGVEGAAPPPPVRPLALRSALRQV